MDIYTLDSTSLILKHTIAAVCVLVLVLGAVSCDHYTPTGTNHHDVDPTIVDINVVVNGILPGDTLGVTESLNLTYSAGAGQDRIQQVDLYLGDVLLESSYRSEDSYMFRSTNYPSGHHLLNLDIIATSGTGSLAESVGAEVVWGTKTYILDIDNRDPRDVVPGGLAITDFYDINGDIQIYWETYDRPSFNTYSIYRKPDNGSDVHGVVRLEIISDGSQNTWIDSTYPGGRYFYWVNLVADHKLVEGQRSRYPQ